MNRRETGFPQENLNHTITGEKAASQTLHNRHLQYILDFYIWRTFRLKLEV